MIGKLIEMWDERYGSEAFAYGEEPNVFFKEQIVKLEKGKILFPAEGEGRNAVYAAQLGWDVSAFDISSEGRKKALQLAQKHGVTIDYQVGELDNLDYRANQFDVIVLIFAHFPPKIKEYIHRKIGSLLRHGGTIIFEGFSKNNLAYLAKDERVGGPRNEEMLFSVDELKNYFPDYEIEILEEKEVSLNEGQFHNITAPDLLFGLLAGNDKTKKPFEFSKGFFMHITLKCYS